MAGGTLVGFAALHPAFSRGMRPLSAGGARLLTGISPFRFVMFADPLDSPCCSRLGSDPDRPGRRAVRGRHPVGCHGAAQGGHNTGLVAGAWGAVQATAAGVGIAAGGALRDVVAGLARGDARPALMDLPRYGSVYHHFEIFRYSS
jgi:BCD family chlorophyll transporter-like MFS transporter